MYLSIGNNACKNQTDQEMIGRDLRGRDSRDLFKLNLRKKAGKGFTMPPAVEF